MLSKRIILESMKPGEQIVFPAYSGSSKWMRNFAKEFVNFRDRKYTMQGVLGVASNTLEVMEFVLVTRVS